MSRFVSDQLAQPAPLDFEGSGAITLRISAEATRLLTAAGGLILEVRERTSVTRAEPAADAGCGEDPLVKFIRDHPLADASAHDATASTLLQCDALDRFGVPNGAKAISIWMWRRWTPEIAKLHGSARPAPTLRRWRSNHPRWGDD